MVRSSTPFILLLLTPNTLPPKPLSRWISKRKGSHAVHARAGIESLVRNGQHNAMFHGYPTAPHRKSIRLLIHSGESRARVCPENFRCHHPCHLRDEKPPTDSESAGGWSRLLCTFSVPQALMIGWMYGPVTPTSGRCKMTMPSIFLKTRSPARPQGTT